VAYVPAQIHDARRVDGWASGVAQGIDYRRHAQDNTAKQAREVQRGGVLSADMTSNWRVSTHTTLAGGIVSSR
jgi:hypothetical protein